ncbi:MAG: arginine--tRNA ligase [Acidobacteriota bacterium]
MLTAVSAWQEALSAEIQARFGVALDPAQIPFTFPPKTELGDAATTVAFALAKPLRRPPAEIAGALAGTRLPGVREIRTAGGYMNLFLDRGWAVERLLSRGFLPAGVEGKIIVEHTNINPNKAAHVGHLRNAVLGDTLVRCLRYLGRKVEVQNYIDDTGVQVADVVVGFQRILGLQTSDVRSLIRICSSAPKLHADLPGQMENWSYHLNSPSSQFPQHLANPQPVMVLLLNCLGRFDAFCWELYAQVAPWYARDEARKAARLETLHLMEEGGNETAEMAALVAEEMVRCHLRTMERLGIRYDVLPHESDILKIGFWASCFEKLKASGAVHPVPADSEDKNRGCWVMALQESEEFKGMSDADKVIVRSNGTVTYIGKDMAYQLWKFGLLGRDFHYRPFPGAPYPIWRTSAGTTMETSPAGEGATAGAARAPSKGVILASEARPESHAGQEGFRTSRNDGMGTGAGQAEKAGMSDGQAGAPVAPATGSDFVIPASGASPEPSPHFGGGAGVYNVIDVRQSYLQKIVKEGLRQMGHEKEAERSVHYAYEMVALATKFVRSEMEKGAHFELSEEELAKPFVEMSGRKGLGFQADLLLDRMKDRALAEIESREPELATTDRAQWEHRAEALATAALRFYMVKYNKNQVVAFDLEQALAFEGDTGPYLQYACVRAENILRKAAEQGLAVPDPADPAALAQCAPHFDEEGWGLLSLFMRVPIQVKMAVDSLDLNIVARQLYDAAQAFHAYYHHFPVIQEPDPAKRAARLLTVALFARLLREGLGQLLGIPVPERM